MTCVVGYIDKKNHRTYMAADSCTSDYWTAWKLKKGEKIIRRNGCIRGGSILFGICGDGRVSNIIRNDFILPEHTSRKMTVDRYVNGPLLAAFREAFKKAGWARVKHNVETIEAHVMIAYHNRLWTMFENFEMMETADPYYAIGCGYPFAFGALAAMDRSAIPIKKRAKNAVLAACRWDPYVEEPVAVRELTWS